MARLNITLDKARPCALRLGLLLILALLFPAAAANAQVGGGTAIAISNGELRQIKSHYYQLQTDMPEWAAQQVADYMDSVFAAYSQRFSKFPVRSTVPPPLYLFANRQDYLSFLESQGINGANTGGLYFRMGNRTGLVGWVEDKNRDKVFAVLRHEAFHQFVSERLGLRLPKWLNEGLAGYFEEGIVGRNEIVSGLVPAQRLWRLQRDIQQNACVPFDELWSAKSADWTQVVQTDGSSASSIYNEAWSIVQFLIHSEDGKYVAAFEKYFQRVGLGEPSPSAFRAAFGLDSPTELQDNWLRYIRGLSPDPISLALEELKSLAAGMQLLYTQGVRLNSVPQLYVALQRFGIPHTPMDNSVFSNVQGITLRLANTADAEMPPELIASDGHDTIRIWWYLNHEGVPEPDITGSSA